MRDTEASVERFRHLIAPAGPHDCVGIVSHSFGDWIARQAIAQTPNHCVRALVSVTPALKLGMLTGAMHLATVGRVPELKIIADRELALANLDLGASLRHTVIWSRIDGCIRQISLVHLPAIEVHDVWATHLTAVLQPNVMRLIAQRMK